MRTLLIALLIAVPALGQAQTPVLPESSQGQTPTEVAFENAESEDDCANVTAYADVKSDYVFNDIGVYALDKPVVQGGVTLSCKSGWWFDVWSSVPLPTRNGWDINNYGAEVDLAVGYTHSVGPITVSTKVSYFATQPFGKVRDDIVLVDAQFALPLSAGTVTVSPYVQPIVWFGIKDFPHQQFVRAGASLAVPLSEHWSLSGDVSRVFVLTKRETAVIPRKGTNRFEASLSRNLGNGWTGTGSIAKSGGLPVVFGIGFSKSF